jgi:aspartate aminotransferase-like enzyme
MAAFIDILHEEHFYRTGFESVRVNGNYEAVYETVIASMIGYNNELLVIGQSEQSAAWRKTCKALDVYVSTIDVDNDIATALETILSVNRNITHILCGSEVSAEDLNKIGELSRKYRRSLIADNSREDYTMADIDKYNIDFLVCPQSEGSLIIARRSKLVQTEGNARNISNDLYTIWQAGLADRRSTLEPMAC